MSRIITLTTDFGLTDEYVGLMKGVILTRAPEATVVDLTHAIERQNIYPAAWLIKSAYRYFPTNTIHVVVVDPGVGSRRKLILLLADGHLFLAPDNGVLGLLLAPDIFEEAYELQCERYYVKPVSSTFHGRDILAPVAAHLAAGLEPEAVGPVISRATLKKLAGAAPDIDSGQGRITGAIIGSDHFGNLLTNIAASSLNALYGHDKSTVRVNIKGRTIIGIQAIYDDGTVGEILALEGSRGFLEIAVNRGDAALLLDAKEGEAVMVDRPGR